MGRSKSLAVRTMFLILSQKPSVSLCPVVLRFLKLMESTLPVQWREDKGERQGRRFLRQKQTNKQNPPSSGINCYFLPPSLPRGVNFFFFDGCSHLTSYYQNCVLPPRARTSVGREIRRALENSHHLTSQHSGWSDGSYLAVCKAEIFCAKESGFSEFMEVRNKESQVFFSFFSFHIWKNSEAIMEGIDAPHEERSIRADCLHCISHCAVATVAKPPGRCLLDSDPPISSAALGEASNLTWLNEKYC